jgi:hypothetical protein
MLLCVYATSLFAPMRPMFGQQLAVPRSCGCAPRDSAASRRTHSAVSHAKTQCTAATSTYGKLFLHSQRDREVARRYMVFVVAKCCGALNFNLCVAPARLATLFCKVPLCKISSAQMQRWLFIRSRPNAPGTGAY